MSDEDKISEIIELTKHMLSPPPVVTTERFKSWGIEELLDGPRELSWLVRNLLTRDTYGMLGGEMKTLKSYVSLFIALGVASGSPVFDRFVVDDPRRVVMYVGEGGRIPYSRRLERLCHCLDIRPSSLADTMRFKFDTAPLDSEEFRQSLTNDLEEYAPELVIIDPLYAYHGQNVDSRNLHAEGAMLSSVSSMCAGLGTTLIVVNHFNQTGTSASGLKRLTMVGGGEWSDSWWFLAHREEPNVSEGEYKLSFDVGSRQWGGSNWELDISLGRLDPDTGEFDGEIAFELRPASGAKKEESREYKILELVRANPARFVKEELAEMAGGRVADNRQVIHRLEEHGRIKVVRAIKMARDGRALPSWVYTPPAWTSQDGTSVPSNKA